MRLEGFLLSIAILCQIGCTAHPSRAMPNVTDQRLAAIEVLRDNPGLLMTLDVGYNNVRLLQMERSLSSHLNHIPTHNEYVALFTDSAPNHDLYSLAYIWKSESVCHAMGIERTGPVWFRDNVSCIDDLLERTNPQPLNLRDRIINDGRVATITAVTRRAGVKTLVSFRSNKALDFATTDVSRNLPALFDGRDDYCLPSRRPCSR